MQIVRDAHFIVSLQNILDLIAQDSLDRAVDFYELLNHKIEELVHMPLKFRQSRFHSDPNIRDLIFKGYVIPYLIDNDTIVILNIFKAKRYD